MEVLSFRMVTWIDLVLDLDFSSSVLLTVRSFNDLTSWYVFFVDEFFFRSTSEELPTIRLIVL